MEVSRESAAVAGATAEGDRRAGPAGRHSRPARPDRDHVSSGGRALALVPMSQPEARTRLAAGPGLHPFSGAGWARAEPPDRTCRRRRRHGAADRQVARRQPPGDDGGDGHHDGGRAGEADAERLGEGAPRGIGDLLREALTEASPRPRSRRRQSPRPSRVHRARDRTSRCRCGPGRRSSRSSRRRRRRARRRPGGWCRSWPSRRPPSPRERAHDRLGGGGQDEAHADSAEDEASSGRSASSAMSTTRARLAREHAWRRRAAPAATTCLVPNRSTSFGASGAATDQRGRSERHHGARPLRAAL